MTVVFDPPIPVRVGAPPGHLSLLMACVLEDIVYWKGAERAPCLVADAGDHRLHWVWLSDLELQKKEAP